VQIDRSAGAALGAAILFGLSTPLAKELVGEVPPLLLAGLLYVGSGVGLLLLLGIRVRAGRRAGITWPRGADAGWLLGAIFTGGAIGPFLFMLGLRQTTAASASLILNLEGVFTALLAWFVFRENFDRRIALGMAAIVAGGVALALASGASMPAGVTVLQCGLLGFVGYGLSLTLFVVALRGLGTARTSAYFSLAPFLGAMFAVVLGAPVSAPLLAAGVLMAIGVWLHLTERHAHAHTHASMKHAHPHVHDEHHWHAHAPGLDAGEPHTHEHVHEPVRHAHAHYPDVHHRHEH